MALPTLTISKNWFTGTNVREVNWDNIRTPVVSWAAGINGGITQISRDAFGSSYVINQNGSATLSKSLQQQINEIGTGTTPFTGDVKIYSGFDLLLYSDAGATLKFSIDGATGNAVAGGNFSLFSGGDFAVFSDVGTTLKFAVDGATGNTFLYAGADFSIFSDAGVTTKFFIDGATGNFGIPATQRFYLDGTGLAGNTYLHESSADVLSSTAGGNRNFQVTSNTVDVLSGADFSVADTKKLFLDGGSDTYITESAANVFKLFTGGTERLEVSGTRFRILNNPLSIESSERFYLDDGGNTYFSEISADKIVATTGGTSAISFENTAVTIESGRQLFIQDGSAANPALVFASDPDTGLIRTAANVIAAIAGGSDSCIFKSEGILLPNTDPPTANYFNRNSGIQARGVGSASAIATGVTTGYNIDSTSVASWDVTVNYDTDFADTDYSVVATPNTGVATTTLFYMEVRSKAVGSTTFLAVANAGGEYNNVHSFEFIATGTQ